MYSSTSSNHMCNSLAVNHNAPGRRGMGATDGETGEEGAETRHPKIEPMMATGWRQCANPYNKSCHQVPPDISVWIDAARCATNVDRDSRNYAKGTRQCQGGLTLLQRWIDLQTFLKATMGNSDFTTCHAHTTVSATRIDLPAARIDLPAAPAVPLRCHCSGS